MNLIEILNQLYSTGLLALAIVMLALAIIIYPTIKSQNQKKR